MIINKLTENEFERIITPILKLEECEVVRRKVYEVLHIWKHSPTDKGQFFTRGECSGVRSTYNGFEIDIRTLNDPKNDYNGTIIQFKKTWGLMDGLSNPNGRLVAKIKKLCERELVQTLYERSEPGLGIQVSYPDISFSMFRRLYLGPPKQNSPKEELWYQNGTLNPKWNKPSKLPPLVNIVSPLSIFTQEGDKGFVTEFWFFPECYERQGDKTVLKEDWLAILGQFPPHG
jgi:hypothetical protein